MRNCDTPELGNRPAMLIFLGRFFLYGFRCLRIFRNIADLEDWTTSSRGMPASPWSSRSARKRGCLRPRGPGAGPPRRPHSRQRLQARSNFKDADHAALPTTDSDLQRLHGQVAFWQLLAGM